MEEQKVQASGTQDGATGTPATQAPATDADWKAERIKAQRVAKAALAENELLKKQLAEFENAKKSDNEKAIEKAAKDAREATLAEVNGTILKKDIRNEIRLKLAEANVPANQVAVILDESKPETVEEAIAAATAYATKWNTDIARPTAAGIGGGVKAAEANSLRPWTREKVDEFTRTHGHAELLKHNAEIVADLGVS